jgi:L-amino acid N-acyltransferase YncA
MESECEITYFVSRAEEAPCEVRRPQGRHAQGHFHDWEIKFDRWTVLCIYEGWMYPWWPFQIQIL